jgi:molybdopterin synthase sulfur carrier subunit
MIRVALPFHLRNLARVGKEVQVEVDGPVTQQAILDKLEAEYPVLQGTIRDHTTQKRRDFIRFFVCGQDWSHTAPDAPLPDEIVSGTEPFRIIGAMAGG